ncbi:MAG: hypothetical protein ACRDJH_20285, partial [Thermomicrobiales bacterium]
MRGFARIGAPKAAGALASRHGELTGGQLAVLLNGPALLFLLFVIAYPLAYALFLTFHQVSLAELR